MIESALAASGAVLGTEETIRGEKRALREWLRSRREEVPEGIYGPRSTLICDTVARLPELARAGVVMAYWPLVDRREVDTRPLLDALERLGIPVALPMATTSPAAPDLVPVRYPGRHGLRAGSWGVLEPVEPAPLPITDISVVVIPALGFDANGFRLGYGKGFYDSFLAKIEAFKVGVALDCCYLTRVPREEHDIAVDLVVTERRLVRPLPATSGKHARKVDRTVSAHHP